MDIDQLAGLIERMGVPIVGFLATSFALYKIVMYILKEWTRTNNESHERIRREVASIKEKVNDVEIQVAELSTKVDMVIDLSQGVSRRK